MRILHVIASLSAKHGGPSKACLEMADAVAARGHYVDVFTTDQDGTDARLDVPLGCPVKKGNINVYYYRANILKLWPAASLGLAQAIKAHVRDYDIVHIHSLYLSHGIAVSSYCRMYGVPYLIRPCGALDPVIFYRHRSRKAVFEWLFERRNFRHAAAIDFASQEEMDHAARVMPFAKGIVVPLGINLAEYRVPVGADAFRQAFPKFGGKRLILFLGRINFKKGLDLLIPAFAQVAKHRRDVHLVLAGPDNEEYGEKVRRWIIEHGIVDRVSLTGMLQGEFKSAALHDAEMFILPSYGENFGIAVVEAMASGLPVVISNNVAIWREVEDAGAGLVVNCDVKQIADAIETLLEDYARRATMGAAARELVARLYAWPKIAKELESIYATFISENSRPSTGSVHCRATPDAEERHVIAN